MEKLLELESLRRCLWFFGPGYKRRQDQCRTKESGSVWIGVGLAPLLILFLFSSGFNFAYRRSATIAHTPNSTTSVLPAAASNNAIAPSQPPTKSSTPGSDKPLSHHLANKSAAPTPPPAADTGKDSPSLGPKVNGTSDKAEKEKVKRNKKDRKEKERERTEGGASTPDISTSASTPGVPEPSTSGTPDPGAKVDFDDSKSPVESTGQRTPKIGKPQRHPWTLFMRMAGHLQVTENEIREFYGEAKEGVS